MSDELYSFHFPKVMPNCKEPDWVSRLRTGNKIWLCKEQRYAIVDMAWDPPEPGCVTGVLRIEIAPGHIQRWYVHGNGAGFDGGQLILPCEGHLEIDPAPIDEPAIRQMRRELASFQIRLRKVEQKLQFPWF